MVTDRSSACRSNVRVLAALIVMFFGCLSMAYAAEHVPVWPHQGAQASSAAGESLQSYEMRKGSIALAPAFQPQASAASGVREERAAVSPGDTLKLAFFDDVTYQVIVDSVSSLQDGTMIIRARLNDHKMATVVLTIGPEGFLITLQDMNRALLYRATGNSRTAAGTVTEINVTKIPPVIR